ncbi:hypothetical protein GQ600_8183 [Phytophthora cactorum]|nr:hypothetical protein GQ600_8183 [Phytophthora cactorum]
MKTGLRSARSRSTASSSTTSTRDSDEKVTVGEIAAAVQDSEAPVGRYARLEADEPRHQAEEVYFDKLTGCDEVIVIDKDMGELRLLEEVSGVRVILCHFHLKKYTRTEMAKAEYGRPASFD